MSRSTVLTACLALLAGFLGGNLGGRSAIAAASDTTIRATRFELLDASGHVLARWGHGDDHNTALQFLGVNGETEASFGISSAGLPLLYINGPDGKNRFALQFIGADANPQIVMSDAKWEGRIVLGNFLAGDSPPLGGRNWGLRLAGPERVSGVAGLGMFSNPETGRTSGELFVYDESGSRVSLSEVGKK